MKKKIGILGGTFDPPHIGHLIIADQILNLYKLDEIRFMPNYLPPHKEKLSNTTIQDRLRMLELSIKEHDRFKIETIELKRKEKSYTYNTMVLLKQLEPDHEFFFIIGGDMIDYLPKWYKIEELMELVQFIGVERPMSKGETTYSIQFADIPSIYISSSMIREKIANGQSVKYLLPEHVISYIEEHKLYGTK
ncbi:nicotinate-nucleotide adenylyltransferase [Caldifermentibacillus hisashii]|uniref:nicotinate-nucleotide adenylyltransferase n=1 Tax=Caldifermentibacillus hisashii TaxID=996558 RepID=UPI003D236418